MKQRKYLWSLFLCLLILGGCASRQEIWEQAVPSGEENLQVQTQAGPSVDAAETRKEPSVGAKEDWAEERASPSPGEIQTESRIKVHVCGAVASPGVYTLPAGARLVEAVEAAGGFAGEADASWCNQARILADQEQIRIYTLQETACLAKEGQRPEGQSGSGENGQLRSAEENGSSGQKQRVNLNTATAQELMSLPGIGESRAQSIISYREQNGPFSSIEGIMQISGIKEALFGKIKDRITV